MWTFKPLTKTEKKFLHKVNKTASQRLHVRRKRRVAKKIVKATIKLANLALKRANRKPRSRR